MRRSHSEEWQFIRSINTSSTSVAILLLRGDFVHVSFFFFATKSEIAICIRKNSITLWTRQRRDWFGNMEINGRRVHSIFPIYGESSLDYSRSRRLARAYVFKTTLQRIERDAKYQHIWKTRFLSIGFLPLYCRRKSIAFNIPEPVPIPYTPSQIETQGFASFPIYFSTISRSWLQD